MKEVKLFMVREEDETEESLSHGPDVRFYDFCRPATDADVTLEAMASMLDQDAECCNAHDFVQCHRALAMILHQEGGRELATRVMRRLVNYDGLPGTVGVCGKGNQKQVYDELRVTWGHDTRWPKLKDK